MSKLEPRSSNPDVVIIGGGPAGLQAAQTLGRIHRTAVLLDSGHYRNERAAHMHNVAGHDGTPPASWRADARRELAAYDTVQVRQAEATFIQGEPGAITVTTADGDAIVTRAVVLATGVRDVLPDVPGLAELWGGVGFVCPFCHGHELTGRTVVVQGGPAVAHAALMMSRIAGSLVVVTDGHGPTPEDQQVLAGVGARVVEARIARLEPAGDGATVVLDTGEVVSTDGFMVRATFEQAAPFAAQLDLALRPSGCVEVNVFGRTSRTGVYAAGDLAHTAALPMPMASVVQAAAAGQLAASAVVMDLLAAERPAA